MRSDAELEALLCDIESDLVECKESLSGSSQEKIYQAICAFCNDLPNNNAPGVVFIGMRDNGTPSGLPITEDAILGDARQGRLSEDHCLATLRDYRTLMQMAQEARKPMFDLKAADGAIGSHAQLVQACWKDFANLCRQIATACDIQQQS